MHIVMAKPLDGPGERGWWYHVYPPEVIIPRMPEPASEAETEAVAKDAHMDCYQYGKVDVAPLGPVSRTAAVVGSAILQDLLDRRGIRQAFDDIDDDTMEEIRSAIGGAAIKAFLATSRCQPIDAKRG